MYLYYDDYDNWAARNLEIPTSDEDQTGFQENFMSAMKVTIDEDISISSYINSENKRDRNNALEDLVESDQLTKAERQSFEVDVGGTIGVDYNAFAVFANKKLGTEIQLNGQLEEQTRDRLKEQRVKHEEVKAKSTGWGDVGNFTGAFAGYAADPLNFAAVAVGPMGAARAVGALAKIGRGMLYAGVEGLVTETLIQPLVYKWKQDIGVDYSVGDAMTNVMLATGVSSTIGGLAGGLSALISKVPADRPDLLKPLVQMREEIGKAIDENVTPEEFFGDIQNTVRAQEGKRPQETPYNELADEAIDVKFQETVNKFGDEKIWAEEIIDPATGESSVILKSPNEVMEKLDMDEARLNDLKVCMNG